jgi:glycosyltransferase involved in cell wall biosynthesis
LAGPVSDPGYFNDQVQPQLGEKVHYAGHLDHSQLARVVGHASAVLVTPLWDEPYGLVVAEAMCSGTPVVAFARGGIPELVGPQSGRLVEPGDLAGMADAIPAAIRLPRDEVRNHALRRCSSGAMLRTYLDLYRDIIKQCKDGDDRLLHSPPRLRASGARDEHLRADAVPEHGVDLFGHSSSASVRRGREATA